MHLNSRGVFRHALPSNSVCIIGARLLSSLCWCFPSKPYNSSLQSGLYQDLPTQSLIHISVLLWIPVVVKVLILLTTGNNTAREGERQDSAFVLTQQTKIKPLGVCQHSYGWLAGCVQRCACACVRACVCMWVSVCSNHHCHSPVKGNILREIRLIVLAFKSKTYCAFQWMRGHKLFSHTLCSLLCLVIQQASRTRWQSWAAWVWEIKEIAPSLLLLAPF